MKLLILQEHMDAVEFNLQFIASEFVSELTEQMYLSVPVEIMESLIEEIKDALYTAVNVKNKESHIAKKNLVRSKAVEIKWWPKQKCFEFIYDESTLQLEREEFDEDDIDTSGIMYASLRLKSLPYDSVEYRQSVSRRYRAEEILHRRMEPVLYHYIREYSVDDEYTDEYSTVLNMFLRKRTMQIADTFIVDVFRELCIAKVLTVNKT